MSSRRTSTKRKAPCRCPKQDLSYGAQLGDGLQKFATKRLKSWMGLGDYTISSNSLVTNGGGVSGTNPQIVSYGEREVIIRYREYVGDVYTHPTVAGKFYPQAYALNPGLVDNFPWLAPIAQQYQQWKPRGILWEFVSTSGDITTNQALGKIIIATDYNTTTLSTSFTNEQEMLAEAYAQEAKPTSNMVHGIECAPKERAREIFFTRSGAIPANQSLGDFDLGQTTVATVGGPTVNTNLGSLYIHYEVSLYKNTLTNGVPSKANLVRWWKQTAPAEIDASNRFGDPTKLKYMLNNQDNLNGASRPGLIDEDFVVTSDSIIFPRWAYVGSVWKFTYYLSGVTTAAVVLPYLALSGLGPNHQSRLPRSAESASGVSMVAWVHVTSNSALQRPTLKFSTGGVMPDTITDCFFTLESAPQWVGDTQE